MRLFDPFWSFFAPWIGAGLLLAGGCSDQHQSTTAGLTGATPSARYDNDGGAPPTPGASSAGANARAAAEPPLPLTLVARDAATRGLAAVERMLAAGLDGPHYLELRRAVACGAPFWIKRATVGSDVLLGPRSAVSEAGGALMALDGAVNAVDGAAARREAEQVKRALLLIREEILRNEVPGSAAATAISGAAYELGAIVLESNAGAPAGPDAVLADLRGTLDAIEQIVNAITQLTSPSLEFPALASAVQREIEPLRARLDAARTSLDLVDRASFVLGTGRLGAALRRFAGGAPGGRADLPYAARVPAGPGPGNGIDEPVSAFTLPAPRRPAPGSAARVDDSELAEIGRLLFLDRRLSRGDVRACVSCHAPARHFGDGLVAPTSLEPGGPPLRHTPTLLYTALHAVQMWDGRTLTAESQALNVIHARAEMGLSPGEILTKLGAIPAYKSAFAAIPGGLTEQNVTRALVAFEVRALAPADAPIDRFARGDEAALSPDQRAGLDVFAGQGRCARCHVPPLFGGSRPRDFAVPVFAVVGVTTDPSARALDPDRGRAAHTGRAADERSFKTPTVRNIARTAPYFHHGRFPKLEDVVDFYNKGAAKFMGLTIENQDPDVRPLKLSAEQVRVLLVFMRTALLDRTSPETLVAPAKKGPGTKPSAKSE